MSVHRIGELLGVSEAKKTEDHIKDTILFTVSIDRLTKVTNKASHKMINDKMVRASGYRFLLLMSLEVQREMRTLGQFF